MGATPTPVDRDMLELMVAYGFLPAEAIAGGRAAAPVSDRPSGHRTGKAPCAGLGLAAATPRAGQSTVIVGLARAWSRAGRSVLLVDLDPGDDLARLLLFGSALLVNMGHSVLDAAGDDALVEPSHTLLPGVDVVFSGTAAAWDPAALGDRLRADPHALDDSLAGVRDRYDRVLFDCPAYPHALRESVSLATDAWIHVVNCRSKQAEETGLPGPALGRILNRLDPAAPPDELFLAAHRGALPVAIPELSVAGPWDLVAGTGGRRADVAFARLAEEIDARLDELLRGVEAG